MASIHPLIDSAIAGGATVLAGAAAIAQDVPIAPKDVGLLALVAAIGGWLVKTVDKWGDRTTQAIEANSKAQGEVATKMALLMQETAEARRNEQERGRQILEAFEDLPQRLALEVKR
jgi:hypothetical protein